MYSDQSRNVAIIVPTWKNRSALWFNMLDYHAGLASHHAVYVGDSTVYDSIGPILDRLRTIEKTVKVTYLQLPGANDTEAISELLNIASEPYAAFAGDDDFLVPASLDKGVRFLEQNPEYSVVHGVSAMCYLGYENHQSYISHANRYGLGYVQSGSGSERLLEYLGHYFETLFSVHRTSLFRQDVIDSLEIADRHFRDLLICCLTVIRGKVKQLDCLYLVRLIHDRQFKAPDTFDWISTEGWANAYHKFQERLSEELSIQDGISPENARNVVKHAFWLYISGNLSRSLNPVRQHGLKNRLTNLVYGNPQLLSVARKLKSQLTRPDNKLTLPKLLSPSSSYYSDFKPIYDVASNNNNPSDPTTQHLH